MPDLTKQRARMVQNQIAARGITNPDVLAAMGSVPRERFVPEALAAFAYEDGPLPIEAGQTISEPYIVALMTDAAKVGPGDRVLEIGTGSGYAAAVLSLIVSHVYTIERHAELADTAGDRLRAVSYPNVDVRTGDGTVGWPEAAPFDAILVTAGSPEVPDALRHQLKIGGRLVMPVGDHDDQRLVTLIRTGPDDFRKKDLGSVMFVPLIREHGGKEHGTRNGNA